MDFEQYKRHLGLKIQYYRNLNNITQAYLSEKIGCTDNYLSLIENGHKNISLKMIYKLSNALGVSASKFFNIED
ncbi:MAG: helix-turn-helix domain-containing protein [Candidatus Gastranaerophilaceae bacterium]